MTDWLATAPKPRKVATASLRLNKGAVELVHEIADAAGCTPREYLEALLQYAGSCYRRPGSWEAAKPFDLSMYLDPDSYADRWF
jgi:hypothetical protein